MNFSLSNMFRKNSKESYHNYTVQKISYKNLTNQDLIIRTINNLMNFAYDQFDDLDSIEIIYNRAGKDNPLKLVFSKKPPYSRSED